jgi:hypothetical protein
VRQAKRLHFGSVVFRLQHQQIRLVVRPKCLASYVYCYWLPVVGLWQSGSLKRRWLGMELALLQAAGEECGAEL